MLLQGRFVVAQGSSGAQLLSQLLGGLTHHPAADKGSNRLQSTIQKQRAQNSLHGVGEHGALAPETPLVFAAAEAQIAAQINGCGYLRQMLPAD